MTGNEMEQPKPLNQWCANCQNRAKLETCGRCLRDFLGGIRIYEPTNFKRKDKTTKEVKTE